MQSATPEHGPRDPSNEEGWSSLDDYDEFGAPLGDSNRKPGSQELGQQAVARALLPVGRSAWAIAAGYLGLFSILVVPAPFAIVAGFMGIRSIRRNPKLHGMPRSIFGIVSGIGWPIVWFAAGFLG